MFTSHFRDKKGLSCPRTSALRTDNMSAASISRRDYINHYSKPMFVNILSNIDRREAADSVITHMFPYGILDRYFSDNVPITKTKHVADDVMDR